MIGERRKRRRIEISPAKWKGVQVYSWEHRELAAGDRLQFYIHDDRHKVADGPHCGSDPHNFEPDAKASTSAQRERHRQAYAGWERGGRRFATGFGYGAT